MHTLYFHLSSMCEASLQGLLISACQFPDSFNANQQNSANPTLELHPFLAVHVILNTCTTQQLQQRWQAIKFLADTMMLLRLTGGRRGQIQHNVRPSGGRGRSASSLACHAGGLQLRRWLRQINHCGRHWAAHTCTARRATCACLAAKAAACKVQGLPQASHCPGSEWPLQKLHPQLNLHREQSSFRA